MKTIQEKNGEVEYVLTSEEYKRLHEATQAMLEALKDAKLGLDWYQSNYPESIEDGDDEVMESIVSAIAKGEQQ